MTGVAASGCNRLSPSLPVSALGSYRIRPFAFVVEFVPSSLHNFSAS